MEEEFRHRLTVLEKQVETLTASHNATVLRVTEVDGRVNMLLGMIQKVDDLHAAVLKAQGATGAIKWGAELLRVGLTGGTVAAVLKALQAAG